MAEGRVLVAGATGQLGGVIVKKLLAAGVPVRAISRRADALAPLAEAGAETTVVDLRDVRGLTDACRGIDQIVATANNNMGKGALSPTRIDLSGYQNLCAAARNARVRRLLYVSYRGVDQFSPVDIFRVKWYIEDAIRRSGVPHVILRATDFMDTWVDLMAADVRKRGAARLVGDGKAVRNFIAVDDVADFVVAILGRDDVMNEAVELGGPSDISFNDLASLVERHLGAKGKRRHAPLAVIKALAPVIRLFNEVLARQLTLAATAASHDTPCPGWTVAAERFGIAPRTVEQYVESLAR